MGEPRNIPNRDIEPLQSGEVKTALKDSVKVLGIVTLRWRSLARRWWQTRVR